VGLENHRIKAKAFGKDVVFLGAVGNRLSDPEIWYKEKFVGNGRFYIDAAELPELWKKR